ncbi:unnamed protein product [Blepharisma stoltei]|uniref:DUF98 domain-containing protein n=1 Tax=Blepharisma stoltei TaxID=1481888 RepID=A0AAU9JU16_9CILI|nr:unnamed protein product [Blepharisma stoltei]
MEVASPTMRILLNHDGSMTKALESLTLRPIKIDLLSETEIENSPTPFIESPAVLRETLLISGGEKLVHAVSYWNKEKYQHYLSENPEMPIGKILISRRIEQFREIVSIEKSVQSERIINLLDARTNELFSRTYVIYTDAKPLCVITETFSDEISRI